MATFVTQVLSLGHFATELDDKERTTGADNAGDLVGKTFGSAQNPVWKARQQMTMVDGNNDKTVSFADKTVDRNVDDYIRFNTPQGMVNRTIDAGMMYQARIVYFDGTSATANVRIIQDGAGYLHLLPPPNSASKSEIDALTKKQIVSISITKLVTNNYNGLDTSRFGLPGDPTFVCFSAEALIATPGGETAAGDLEVGDLVRTLDGLPRPIRWIGKRKLDAAMLAQLPKLQPIRIRAGALGLNVPDRDLIVSPQHRVLIRSRIAQNMFGASEILVAAKHLCQLDGVEIATDVTEVTYVHFLLERHEIVFANGAETESMLTGVQALDMVGAEARDEILTLFPELAAPDAAVVPVRPLISGKDGRKLAARIASKAAALAA